MINRCATTVANHRGTARRAFAGGLHRGVTLVELMVVMVILSILSSLMLSGLLVARNRSRQVKTLATIRKLNEVILPYYEEYETRRPRLDPVAVNRIAGDGSRANRDVLANYKRIALRRLIALELPDQFSDVQRELAFEVKNTPYDPKLAGSTPLTEIPPVARRYGFLAGQSTTGTNTITSSDLLHMIVTRGVVADPDIIAHFRDDEVADTNGNGLKEFIDGWGKPIAFKRWPVGFNSPLQPITGQLTDVEPLISSVGHRLVPLIYSAGPDGSHDIEAMAADWPTIAYDPFHPALRLEPGAGGHAPINGEVFLVPIVSGGVETFTAVRYDGSSLPTGAFQTVGSPRDTGSSDGSSPNGKLESADNIHNHDLRQ